jgi:hypothetical protein
MSITDPSLDPDTPIEETPRLRTMRQGGRRYLGASSMHVAVRNALHRRFIG